MKRMLQIVALVALSAVLLTSCGGKKDGADGAKKSFTMGFDASFPPYGFKDPKTGELKGFDLDMAAEVAKRNDWNLVKKPIDWPSKDSELNAGTIDCIWNGFTMNEDRKDIYTWTEPYVSNRQVILVKKNSGIKKLTDLKGKAVVSQDGSSGADALKAYLEDQKKKDPTFALKKLELVPEYTTANTMLMTGAVDAISVDSAVAEGLMAKSGGQYVLLDETLVNELFAVAFKKGNTAMRDQVQKTLKGMVKDGTMRKILDHWRTVEKGNGGAGIDFILKAD